MWKFFGSFLKYKVLAEITIIQAGGGGGWQKRNFLKLNEDIKVKKSEEFCLFTVKSCIFPTDLILQKNNELERSSTKSFLKIMVHL